MNRIFTVLVLLGCLSEPGITQPGWTPVKKAIVSNIDEQSPDLISMSDAIWGFAETAFLESQSAMFWLRMPKSRSFRVQRGSPEMPTSIVAEFGSDIPSSGSGRIRCPAGFVPKITKLKRSRWWKEPRSRLWPHNLFGVASLGAATAIKDMIASASCKVVRFYGTPAEEKYFWQTVAAPGRASSTTWTYAWTGTQVRSTMPIPTVRWP